MQQGKLKFLIVSAALFLIGSSAFAHNEQMFDCMSRAGGVFQSYEPGQQYDLPMCEFGQAAIGTQSIVNHVDGYAADQATTTFLGATQSVDPANVCATYGATEKDADTNASCNYRVCVFSDGSVIEAATLARGVNDPANAGLTSALKRNF